jgi:hypothetical protein
LSKAKTGKTAAKERADTLIVNASELVTLAGGNEKPRTGKRMRDLGIIKKWVCSHKRWQNIGCWKNSRDKEEL